MRLLRLLAPSLRALWAHRGRTLLAVTGVAVGIAAVVLTSAIGGGARTEVERSIGSMGTRLLVVRPAQARRLVGRKTVAGFVTTLRLEDGEALGELPEVTEVAPSVETMLKVRSENGAMAVKLLGTASSFPHVRGYELASGRFFGQDDDDTHGRVAVLGARVATTLFPGADPLGQVVRVRGVPFEVIGTMRPKGVSADGADADNQVYVPVRTALRRVLNARSLTAVFVGVRAEGLKAAAARDVTALLRERHRGGERGRLDDFEVQDQVRLVSIQQKAAGYLTAVTTGFAAVALLVGGAGILGLFLLSVRERTPEIGLRMAVGARPRDIFAQFLAEATLLSAAGGGLGLVSGVVGAWAVAAGTSWSVRISAASVLVSAAVSAVIGVVFGVLPARRAALLHPVRALAQE